MRDAPLKSAQEISSSERRQRLPYAGDAQPAVHRPRQWTPPPARAGLVTKVCPRVCPSQGDSGEPGVSRFTDNTGLNNARSLQLPLEWVRLPLASAIHPLILTP